jgi:hypothetical protein
MRSQTKRVQSHDRKLDALALRKAGLTYQAIADAIGVTKNAAWKLVGVALKETIQEPADELRTLELERLDALSEVLWPMAMAGDLHAHDRYIRLMERRAKLLGLDAPVRKELTGKDGVDLFQKAYITVSPDDWDDDSNRDD